jgi:hypothetical protein
MGRWAPRTQLCEVVLNGEYIGVYVLMERIKQNPGRVNVDELTLSDTTNNELTGGYIFKIDKTTAGGIIAWSSPFLSASPGTSAIAYQMHDPEIVDMQPIQLQYIENQVTNWENALAGPNFADPILGYKPYIDEASFIDFMLVNELSKNVDGYRISTFLHKNRVSEGGEIVAGPLWDFNLGWGNSNYCQGSQIAGWEIDFNNICAGGLNNPFWWRRLLEDPDYSHSVKCRWLELRSGTLSTQNLMNYIDSLATILTVPAERNYIRWPILGTYVWPNNFIGNTYQEEIDYLKTWTQNRLTWMDDNMFGTCTDLGIPSEEVGIKAKVFPNPASKEITIQLEKKIDNASLKIFSAQGVLIQELNYNTFIEETIDVRQLAQGFYFLNIYQNNELFQTTKIAVK